MHYFKDAVIINTIIAFMLLSDILISVYLNLPSAILKISCRQFQLISEPCTININLRQICFYRFQFPQKV